MSDELNRLRDAMRAATPEPDPAANASGTQSRRTSSHRSAQLGEPGDPT